MRGRAWRLPAVIGLALLPAAVQTPAGAAEPGAAETRATARVSDSGSYRYWAFWEQNGKSGDRDEWSYATQGPSVLRPEDGAVIGFRFALSENSQDAGKPRGRAEFADICGGTDAEQGSKRIALSIDPGTRAHAPRGETPPEPRTVCARVADDATAADALAQVAKPLRYNSAALLCAIDGYPERGCGEQISGSGKGGGNEADGSNAAGKDPGKGEDTDEDGSGAAFGSATGVAAGIAAVAALSLAAARRARRRR
ncbi:hypothetical protein DB35_16910 [Streptomyces abyssalis]|uniref:Secreted protein n=1 Tax=Streptomyces abyssalis TaxID=933944 RepID=A0A1E7JLV1_9ACTN|nr:hypothetical protein AN215_18085 [Streptomyces abyssalis]OEU91277.1 hypothetical protein DB35_16910 [Streptomyces abyssalis]